MRYSIIIGILTVFSFGLGACYKEELDTQTYQASINVVNAIPSIGTDIKVNFTGAPIVYSDARNLNFRYFDGKYANGTMPFAVPTNRPVTLALSLSTDTTKPFFTTNETFNAGDIFTLYVSGTPESPAGSLVKDDIPVREDSSTGVRFVNLFSYPNPISINLAGNANGSEFASLPYQGITDFKSYPALIDNEFYLFEVHDAVTGDLLTTFFYDAIARFRNVTLVIRGRTDGDPFLEVSRINNY